MPQDNLTTYVLTKCNFFDWEINKTKRNNFSKKKNVVPFHHFYFPANLSPPTKGQLTNCDFKIVGTPPFYLPTSKNFSSTANNLKLQSVKYAVHNYLFTKRQRLKKNFFFANLYVQTSNCLHTKLFSKPKKRQGGIINKGQNNGLKN